MLSIKKKHYLQAYWAQLISRVIPLKYIILRLVLSERLAKWEFLLQEFEIIYWEQTLANFLGDHPILDEWEFSKYLPNKDVLFIEMSKPLKMFFDGAIWQNKTGARIIFITPKGEVLSFTFSLTEYCSNNLVEYHKYALKLMTSFDRVTLEHIP